jgi:hypothetical protein
VDGNAAAPVITTIGTGNYIVSFPSLTPAPAEGDTLYVKVNGSIDSTGDAWTEAVYRLKVLPKIVTAMDGKIDTIDSVVDDILVDTGTDIPASISSLNDFDPTTDQVVASNALTSNQVAAAVWSELLSVSSGVPGSVAERLSKIVYVGQSFTYTKDSNPSHTQDVTIT